eukprot:5545954-Ditylum_brightwellii.AAC.1
MQLQQSDHWLGINKADTNKNVQIQYKSVLNPHKTLGCYKAPAGTSKVHATVLDKIGQKALKAFTAKCGYNRNMAYVIEDGPKQLFANSDQSKVPLKQWLFLMLDLQRNWPICFDYGKDIPYIRLADKFCKYSPSAQNSHVFTSGSDIEWTPMNTSSLVYATSIDGAQS